MVDLLSFSVQVRRKLEIHQSRWSAVNLTMLSLETGTGDCSSSLNFSPDKRVSVRDAYVVC